MADNEIIATIGRETITYLLPQHPNLAIEHLCLGTKLAAYTYNADVRSVDGSGWVTGGGTRTGSYRVFDFGFAVANTSSVHMRVQIVLSKIDADGYAVESKEVWADVSPHEKRRLWANLDLRERSELNSYAIKEVGIAATPVQGFAPYEAATYPNRRLHDVFAGSMDAVWNNTVLDSLNLSLKAQGQVREAAKRGLSAYFTYVKWVAILFGVVFLLGVAGMIIGYILRP